MEMIRQVENSKGTIIQNANKRKLEENKKQREQLEIDSKVQKITDLERELQKRKSELAAKKDQLEKYKIYSDFLEDVVNAEGENKEFSSIEDLKARFYILRKENDNLTNKHNEINKNIWDIKQGGKKKMEKLQNELYMMQKKMHLNQNSKLEPEYEYESTSKNDAIKLRGQVISAVNNIYEMCVNQMHKKTSSLNNRAVSTTETDVKLMKALCETNQKDKNNENTNLLMMFNKKLETIGETIEDLREVARLVPEYSKDNTINEEAIGSNKLDKPKPTAVKASKNS